MEDIENEWIQVEAEYSKVTDGDIYRLYVTYYDDVGEYGESGNFEYITYGRIAIGYATCKEKVYKFDSMNGIETFTPLNKRLVAKNTYLNGKYLYGKIKLLYRDEKIDKEIKHLYNIQIKNNILK